MREKLRSLINVYIDSDGNEELEDYLLENGVIVLPYNVKVGDKVYYPSVDEDEKEWQVDEDEVTDVCTKGIYVSDVTDAKNNGCLILWDEIGDTVFFDKEDAERKCKE